jgi:hypothetical protein
MGADPTTHLSMTKAGLQMGRPWVERNIFPLRLEDRQVHRIVYVSEHLVESLRSAAAAGCRQLPGELGCVGPDVAPLQHLDAPLKLSETLAAVASRKEPINVGLVPRDARIADEVIGCALWGNK